VSDPIVGIDLGTSNTVVAYTEETGAVSVLADEGGYKIHPSVVSFHPNGGVVVGAAAKQRKVIDPKNTIYSVKRLIGRTFNSPEVTTARGRMPYQIKEGQNQQPIVVTRGGEFAVPEVSAIILDHVRNVAAAQLQTPVNRAVVTVPASFNDAQRSATATAGAIAGLTIVRVLNEPTAAALAYGNTRNLKQVIAVYDFGGGTFDITILKLEDQVYEVLGTAGDTFLGGDDLDERLVDRMVDKFLSENRIDLRTNEVSMMRLRAVAEQTKIELSRRSRAVVRVDEIAYGANGKALDLQIEITRDEFVRQVADIIDRTFPVCQEALAYSGLSTDKINDVILVGGTTKIPYVRDQVSRFFARAPRTDVSPEDAVAIGASLQATSLERILNRPSRQSGAQQVPSEFLDTNTQTETRSALVAADEFTDASATMPKAEYPVPQDADESSELELLPPEEPTESSPAPRGPKRATAGYSEVTRRPSQTSSPDIDRAPARGQHHDRFEERTPPPSSTPPVTAPIGRLTKTGLTTPRDAPPPTPPVRQTQPSAVVAPRTTQPRVAAPSTPPTTQPRVAQPATTMQGRAVEPPPAGLAPLGGERPAMQPMPAQAPTLIVEPPRVPPPRAPQPFPAPPPEPPTRPAMPQIAAQAATMMIEPAAASTAKGFGVLASDTDPTMTAGTTAKGFQPPQQQYQAPPQTYPVSRSPVVLDVTPRGLGVGTVAGYCEELIRRNSRVPTEIRKLFTTSRDSQDTVHIIVCQGESRRLDSNVIIGDLTLAGLPARPRGETSIEVTFMLDASGILQVRARDAHTGREQRASLDLVGAMPQAEVAASRERMQQLRR